MSVQIPNRHVLLPKEVADNLAQHKILIEKREKSNDYCQLLTLIKLHSYTSQSFCEKFMIFVNEQRKLLTIGAFEKGIPHTRYKETFQPDESLWKAFPEGKDPTAIWRNDTNKGGNGFPRITVAERNDKMIDRYIREAATSIMTFGDEYYPDPMRKFLQQFPVDPIIMQTLNYVDCSGENAIIKDATSPIVAIQMQFLQKLSEQNQDKKNPPPQKRTESPQKTESKSPRAEGEESDTNVVPGQFDKFTPIEIIAAESTHHQAKINELIKSLIAKLANS